MRRWSTAKSLMFSVTTALRSAVAPRSRSSSASPMRSAALLDGDGIVPAMAHAGRDGGGMHLVQEELHSESSLRSFSQAASSRSAMSSLSAISASISSVNSA